MSGPGRPRCCNPTLQPALEKARADYHLQRKTGRRRNVVKSPKQADFDVSVEESGVHVTFRPTDSHYSFYRLVDVEDIERHGPVSLSRIRHANKSGDTAGYIASEVQEMAIRLATSAVLEKARAELA
jgi:hypothetical protein